MFWCEINHLHWSHDIVVILKIQCFFLYNDFSVMSVLYLLKNKHRVLTSYHYLPIRTQNQPLMLQWTVVVHSYLTLKKSYKSLWWGYVSVSHCFCFPYYLWRLSIPPKFLMRLINLLIASNHLNVICYCTFLIQYFYMWMKSVYDHLICPHEHVFVD